MMHDPTRTVHCHHKHGMILGYTVIDQFEFPLNKRRLYKYGAMTVRDVQHAILKLGYTPEQLLRNCPKSPEGTRQNEVVSLVLFKCDS